MHKIANFLITFRKYILIFMLVLTIIFLILIPFVKINYDLTNYLPNSSNMKIGMELMENEFQDGKSSEIKIMIHGLSNEEKTDVYNLLLSIDNETTISYDSSSTYNNDDYTLYIVNINDDAYSIKANDIYNKTETALENYQPFYAGNVVEANSDLIITVIIWGFILLIIILIILSHSWFEPIIFLISIGSAIILNMGTNIFLPTISNITFSISAILQLVLSMDYSIMLMERYRQEKQNNDNINAMKNAIAKSFQSIFSSSFTTIMSLLCLVFLSYKMGLDMGIVLAKGILMSLITAFTILPGLILIFDKLIIKTTKKTIHIKMNKFASFGYRFRYISLIIFIMLLCVGIYYSRNIGVDFFLSPQAKDSEIINEKFPPTNDIIILYKSEDNYKINDFINTQTLDLGTANITSYQTSLGKELTSLELSQTMIIDEDIIKALIYHYFDGEIDALTLNQLTGYINTEIITNPLFVSEFNSETIDKLTMLQTYTTNEIITGLYNANQLSIMLNMDQTMIENTISMYYTSLGEVPITEIELYTYIGYLLSLSSDPMYSSMFTPEAVNQLQLLYQIMNSSILNTLYNPDEISSFFTLMGEDLNVSFTNILYLMYFGNANYNDTYKLSIDSFMGFLTNNLINDENYNLLFSNEDKQLILENYAVVLEGRNQLIQDEYSRLIITTNYSLFGNQVLPYMENITNNLNELDIKYYAIGNIAMSYEMEKTFTTELNLITILTIIVIFIIVALAFKSLFIPLILVSFIQTSIYLTMSLSLFEGRNIYFIAVVIVQAILIGAAIDYAIFFTTYYRNERKEFDVKTSLVNAYNGSITTIFTSSVILIVITTVLGIVVNDPTIQAVIITLAKGMAIAVFLTIFILPFVITIFDKAVCYEFSFKRKNKKA